MKIFFSLEKCVRCDYIYNDLKNLFIIEDCIMLGAIIGDVIGSCYEWNPQKTKDFSLFTIESCLTDDSFMTLAVGCACSEADLNDETDFKRLAAAWMRKIGR